MSVPIQPWTLARHHFALASVLESKSSHTVAVIIPAQNEAATLGRVLEAVGRAGSLVDELVVVDDHSTDGTEAVAQRHGARVVRLEGTTGKGSAMTAGLAATTADLVVFLDADVLNTEDDFIPRLLQPLFERPSVHLVKGYYERPLHHMPHGGGRVNELAARPILSLLYPALSQILQPLAGETAGRREALRDVALEPTYGVEIALLIDIAQRFGAQSVAQVDLGVRRHRNRPLHELRPMAVEVLRAALSRSSIAMAPRD